MKTKQQIEENLQESSEYWSCEYYYGKYDSGFCSNTRSKHYKKECPFKGEG